MYANSVSIKIPYKVYGKSSKHTTKHSQLKFSQLQRQIQFCYHELKAWEQDKAF